MQGEGAGEEERVEGQDVGDGSQWALLDDAFLNFWVRYGKLIAGLDVMLCTAYVCYIHGAAGNTREISGGRRRDYILSSLPSSSFLDECVEVVAPSPSGQKQVGF